MSRIRPGGIRRTGAFVSIALCLALVSPAKAQTSIKLPDFGDASGSVFTGTDEQRLGDAFLREIRASTEILEDPEVDAYVNALGFRLAAASDEPARPFTFVVVSDPVINAFAGPNGVIGLNTGLLLAVDTESELAAVLAHEIAHVTQQHIARAFELQSRYSIPVLAGLLAAIVIGTQDAQAGGAATAAIIGAQAQGQVDAIRANEYEADRVGIRTLSRAGFDPGAMATFFARLQEASRYYRQPPEFLSTHPVTSARIAESRARAARHSYKQYPDSEAFLRVRAKLQVLVNGPEKALAEFQRRAADGAGASPAVNRYGIALALMALERYGKARPILARLVEKAPQVLAYQDALARTLRKTGETRAALDIYRKSLRVYLNDRLMTFGLAELWLDANRPDRASEVLEDYVRSQSTDARAFHLLAKAHERAGRQTAARAALAEHHYLNGRLSQAIFQLERAQRAPDDDYYLNARVAARLKELRREQTLRGSG